MSHLGYIWKDEKKKRKKRKKNKQNERRQAEWNRVSFGADQARAFQRIPSPASDFYHSQKSFASTALFATNHDAQQFRPVGRQSHLDKPEALWRMVQRQ